MRIVRVMKRWWLIAVVFTLALSLTSCSKQVSSLQSGPGYSFGYCDGSLGSFDVYVLPNPSDPYSYELSIIPVSLTEPGTIAQVVLANSSPSYDVIETEVVLQPQQEIDAPVSASDMQNYYILSITPFDQTGQPFAAQTPEMDTTCSLPAMGSGGGTFATQAYMPRTSPPSGLGEN